MPSNMLARIADPRIADPEAGTRGAVAGNALRNLVRQREANALTPAAMSGDQNALAKLSGLDYERAASIDDRAHNRQRQAAADTRAQAGERRAQTRFDQEQAAQQSETIAKILHGADTPERFQQAVSMLRSRGVDTSELKFEERDFYIRDAMSMADVIRSGQDPTKAMQEYQFAQSQGFEGSFLDYQKGLKSAGATTVNVGQSEVGTIPQGFELITDPETGARSMRAIEGGPAATEAAEAAAAEEAADAQRDRYANVVTQDIDRALEMLGEEGLIPMTGVGSITSIVGGTPAHDLSKLLDTVKSNAGFDRLQAMRDASPTGGALGQVSNIELQMLQAAIGSMAQSQSREQLEFNLKRVSNIYADVIHGEGNGPRHDLSGGDGESDKDGDDKATGTWNDLGNGIRIRVKP